MKTLFAASFIFLVLQSCQSSEIGNSKDVNPETIYRSYTISYTEGSDMVRCVCQCRFAGQNGTTLVLNSPSDFRLDGDNLFVDSSVIDGAYYYIERRAEGFEGKHNLVYTDINGKPYAQHFNFTEVKCTGLPGQTTATDIPVTFSGLKDGNIIHVELHDTSSATEDVSRLDTISNNQIIIRGKDLARLKSGPVNMEFYIDENTPLESPAKEGGNISLFYRFKPRTILLEK
jgi:hypothetical protein